MYFPDGQSVQVGDAVMEYLPEEQKTQDEAVVGSFAFFPASQLMQAARLAWRETWRRRP